jgi:hypothetical protein
VQKHLPRREYIVALNAIDERAAYENFVSEVGGYNDESLIRSFRYPIGDPFRLSAH